MSDSGTTMAARLSVTGGAFALLGIVSWGLAVMVANESAPGQWERSRAAGLGILAAMFLAASALSIVLALYQRGKAERLHGDAAGRARVLSLAAPGLGLVGTALVLMGGNLSPVGELSGASRLKFVAGLLVAMAGVALVEVLRRTRAARGD